MCSTLVIWGLLKNNHHKKPPKAFYFLQIKDIDDGKTYIIFIFITFHTNVYLTCTKIKMRDSMIITDYRELMDTSSYI